MELGIAKLNLPAMPNVDTDKFNSQLHETNELAEIISCTNTMSQYIDQFYTLYLIDKIYTAKTFSKKVEKVVQATVPSVEVSIFSIAGAIIKALYNVCRWFLTVIGKIVKWFFGFFKRNNKDTLKVIEKIDKLIPMSQNEIVGHAISEHEIKEYCKCFKEHCAAANVSLNPQSGTTIPMYKQMWFNAFNSKVSNAARVTMAGELIAKPLAPSASNKLGPLGWTSSEKMREAIGIMDDAEEAINSQLKALKESSKDIKRIVIECEARDFVPNKFIEEKGPEAINAACFVTILFKDMRMLKRIEDRFGAMVDSAEKVCRKYVSSI